MVPTSLASPQPPPKIRFPHELLIQIKTFFK
ncbi:hypothetical protein E2C01_102762 [Portunus trituberculatus]|uniref:Uncharacterized protein n=1 Tax=Portunus trituberculatus TaxID=210409 RepID=A0A5B7KPW1_PORTR|nr:hypothetical protein [Portunus trituberculatus]